MLNHMISDRHPQHGSVSEIVSVIRTANGPSDIDKGVSAQYSAGPSGPGSLRAEQMSLIDRIRVRRAASRRLGEHRRFDARFGGDWLRGRPGLRSVAVKHPFGGFQVFGTSDPRWILVTTADAEPFVDDEGYVRLTAPHLLVSPRPQGKGYFEERNEEFLFRLLVDVDYFSTEGVVSCCEVEGRHVLSFDSAHEAMDAARDLLEGKRCP